MTEGPAHIEIRRDVDGIAHVRAATLLDALTGQGWAATEDRLWQMELDRRKAAGRLAEIVGPSAVATDAFHRRMDLAAAARTTFDHLGSEARAALAAYAEGVNRVLATGPRTVELDLLDAPDPEPWEPWHSIALYQVRHLAMGTYETKLWRSGLVRRLGPAAAARLWPSLAEVVVDPASDVVRVAVDVGGAMAGAATALGSFGEGELGSNNLAIAGARTATGRPIVAGDPHRATDVPNVYWQNHLTCPDLDVIGLSFPGVPGFPHFGHNGSVAWCITHGMADDQDLFVERLRRTAGEVEWAAAADDWRPATRRVEEIGVAGAPSVAVECLGTAHGPIITGDGAVGLALGWTATAAPDTTFDALLPMLRASDVSQLDEAMAPWVVPVNNLLMADTQGAIAYRLRGRLAFRARDNGWTAVPGDDPGHDWLGFVADADLFRWRDPADGVLVTANQRIASGHPYVSHDWAHPARAATLAGRLTGRSDWDVPSVTALLGDTASPVAAAFARRLAAVAPSHPLEAAAQALLDGWDHRMDAGAAAAVYGTVRGELVRLVSHDLGLVQDRLPGVVGPTLHQTLRFVNARLAFWIDDPSLVSDAVLATALRFAVRHLELTQGTDPARWRWGSAHTARFVHPLAALRPDLTDRLVVPPPVELGGDNEAVWASSTAPPTTQACNGPVARYVFDVGDWDASVWIVPHGVSGDPCSPHHLDQLDDWAQLRMRPMRYSAAAVDAATVSTRRL